MRINSVIILTTPHRRPMFRFMGLILGVPVCTYTLGHAIRYKQGNAVSSHAVMIKKRNNRNMEWIFDISIWSSLLTLNDFGDRARH